MQLQITRTAETKILTIERGTIRITECFHVLEMISRTNIKTLPKQSMMIAMSLSIKASCKHSGIKIWVKLIYKALTRENQLWGEAQSRINKPLPRLILRKNWPLRSPTSPSSDKPLNMSPFQDFIKLIFSKMTIKLTSLLIITPIFGQDKTVSYLLTDFKKRECKSRLWNHISVTSNERSLSLRTLDLTKHN
jgi:hypothetical protein